jgi:hypothetical protein
MSEQPATPWYQVWLTAITEPNTETYQDLVEERARPARTAYTWIALSGLLGGLFWAFRLVQPHLANADLLRLPTTIIFRMVFIPALLILIAVAAFSIIVGLRQLMSKLPGGTGSFGQLAFATAAYFTPLFFVLSLLWLIPNRLLAMIGSVLILLYEIVLATTAIKAVHGLTTARAVIAAAAVSIVILLLGSLLFSTVF